MEFSNKNIRTAFFAFMLILNIFAMGCSEARNPQRQERTENERHYHIEAKNWTDSKLQSEVVDSITTHNGTWVLINTIEPKNTGKPQFKSYLKNTRTPERILIPTKGRASNIIKVDGEFIFTTVGVEQQVSGALKLNQQQVSINENFGGNSSDIEVHDLKTTEVASSVFKKGDLLSGHAADKLYKQLSTLFDEAIGAFLWTRPVLEHNSDNELRTVYKNDWVSTAQDRNGSQTLQPLDSRLSDAPQWVYCRQDKSNPNAAPSNVFAVMGTGDALASLYEKADSQTSIDGNHRTRIVFLNANPRTWKILNEVAIHSSTVVFDCQKQSQNYLVGGYQVPQSLAKLGWFARIRPNGEMIQRAYDLPQSTYIDRVWIIGSDLFLSGSYNFYQAPSGSLSHRSAFIIRLNDDYWIGHKDFFSGVRSTTIRSIRTIERNQTLKLQVGGSTEGPDTHSPDRSSKPFFAEIPVVGVTNQITGENP